MTTSFVLARVAEQPVAPRTDAPHRTWRSGTDGWQIEAWADRGWEADNLVGDGRGAVAWGGWPVPVGRAHRPGEVAAGLAEAAAIIGSTRWDDLRGTYGAVVVDAQGVGRVFSDLFGLRPIYWADVGGALVAGTDVHRVAAAAFGGGARPDARTAAAIASVGYRPPGRSGYEGVRTLGPGETIVLDGRGRWHVESGPFPWLDIDDLRSASAEELIELISVELRRGLETILALHQPTVELTGGKDSRLVLALLLEMGVAHQLRFETAGLPEMPDVQVAEQIAAMFGLEHQRTFESANVDGLPYDVIFDRFVLHTAGMVSGWDARPIVEVSDAVRISGLNGEALRTHHQLPASSGPDENAEAIERWLPASALGLARPEFGRELLDAFRARRDDVRAATTSAHDAFDTLLFEVQTRQQYGPLDEIQRFRRFVPLTSARAIRAAFALGGPRRHAELVHHELIARAAPALADVRFAGDRWPSDLAAFLPGRAPSDGAPPMRPPAGTAVPAAAPARPLMATLHRSLADDRRRTLLAQFDDPSNPVWELLDLERARRAVDDYAELRPKQRKELYGAASAARWLAR